MALPAWLSTEDLLKFRTRFCERFLIQGECSFGEKCQYSHNLLWRRRSPQKFSYMPLMCPDVITWIGKEGRRHVSINCRNGKNCNHAHSREEVLYHPSVYKTSMCETWNCSRYYCPFAHSMDELVNKPGNPDPVVEDMRLRQLNFEDFWEDNDFCDPETGTGPIGSPILGPSAASDFDISSLQMRRVLHRPGVQPSLTGGVSLITATSLESSRIGPSCLQSLSAGSFSGSSNPDPGFVTLTQGLRVELIVRAVSPLTGAELCLASSRAPWEGGAASANGTQNRRGQQQASMVVKVIPVTEGDPGLVSLMNQLQSVARSEHKNILSVKKVQLTRLASGAAALTVAYERCSTSLYTTIADGYRSKAGVGGVLPRGLAGRMSSNRTGAFTATSGAVGKIAELLSAVQRFHSLGMTHGRISPSNLFIDADANLKLGDFDSKYALLGDGDKSAFLAEPVAAWQSAEITDCLVGGGDLRTAVDWKHADVFAAGMCVFTALTGQHPFGTFADDERVAAAGAAATARVGSLGSMFIEGKEAVMDNMRNGNVINQHLLYGTPLLLDLVLRMLVVKTEVGELLTHPLFWDFYSIARFFTRLPQTEVAAESAAATGDSGAVVRAVCDTCPVPWTSGVATEEWKLIGCGSGGSGDFKDSVFDMVRAVRTVLAKHKGSGCVMCSSSGDAGGGVDNTIQHQLVTGFVNRMVARFPAVVVRAWDAARLATGGAKLSNEATQILKRNHLSWMNSRPRLLPQPDGRSLMLPSHGFVREYYLLVGRLIGGGGADMVGSDESPEILASIVALAAPSPSPGPVGPPAIDPAVLSTMLSSFGAMMRADMLPANVPKSFVMSLIEAAAGSSMVSTAAGSPVATPSPQASPSSSAGVFYSTILNKPLQLPSGSTSPAFAPIPPSKATPVLAPAMSPPSRKGSPPSNRDRRISSCDGWEYAVACPPTMIDLGPRHAQSASPVEGGEDDESPPPGFQTVWQSMADDGL